MTEPNKNGCWNCGHRKGLLCKANPRELPETRLGDSLKQLNRPLEEGQFSIPITEAENEMFGDVNDDLTGRYYGEDCVLFIKHRGFIFR